MSSVDANSTFSMNQTSPTTATGHNNYFATIRYSIGIWEFFIFLIGCPANAFVLWLTVLIMKSHSRSHNQWFVASMTCADWLFTVVHAPLMFASYSLNSAFDSATCYVLYISTYTCTTASSLSMLLLNMDKFVYLHRPLHYFMIVTKPKIICSVFIAWITAFVWALLFLRGPFTVYTPPCDFRPNEDRFYLYILFATLFFTLPILVSLIISVYVAGIVIKAKKDKQARHARHRVRPGQETLSVVNGQAQHRQQQQQQQSGTVDQLKTITFVFTTTIWSSLSCLPYRTAYSIYVVPGYRAKVWEIWLFYLFFALMAVNAAANPFITVFTQHQYMQKIKDVLKKVNKNRLASMSSSSRRSTSMATVHTIVESRKSSLDKDGFLPVKTAEAML